MHRQNLDALTVYELSEKTDNIKSDLLLDLYSEKKSDTVYFTLEGKLCGIVGLHDLLNRVDENIVPINNKFSKMNCFDEKQAREIFSQNKFTKIPVVDRENHLLGDYSNLDDGDAVFIKWLVDWECVWMHLKKYIKDKAYKNIYVINPSEEKRYLKTYMKQIFETAKVNVTYIDKREMDFILNPDERTLIVGADLEELRCIRCRNAIISLRTNLRWEYMSFIGLWNRVEKYARNRRLIYYLGVKDPIIEKDILSELQDRGITILAIYNDAYYLSDYIKDLFQKNQYYKKIYGNNRFRPVESEAGKEFFGELLENEDYKNGIAQKDIEIGDSSLKNNYKSKYYNRVDGYRKTCYQPEHFWGTIYLFGPCLVRGWLLEDKYTMASQLQGKLNSEGYPYLVVNCGRPIEQSVCQELRRTVFHKGDIIIAYTGSYDCETIESVEIRRFFEENKIPAGWCVDLPIHMNHKATGLMVELLYDKLKKYLTVENKEMKVSKEEIKVGVETGSRSFRELTKTVYLDRWFDDPAGGGIRLQEAGYWLTAAWILLCSNIFCRRFLVWWKS